MRDLNYIVVGNKIDIEKDRKVSQEDAKNFADSLKALYFETSVKKNINVQEIFQSIINFGYEMVDTFYN